MTLFVGIDPGAVSGAWGIIDHHGEFWSCGSIPHKDGIIQAKAFRAELLQAIDRQDAIAVVEDVHSMPKQGVSSTFKFGRAVGAIQAVCELSLKDWVLVTPQRWKKDMGLTQDKTHGLAVAKEMFPNAPLSKKKDHNLAEALMLAAWIRKHQQGE